MSDAASLADTPYLKLGSAIAAARIVAGFPKQADLARALGVTQQSVSRWEAGTHRPKSTQVEALAAALKLAPADLRGLAGYAETQALSFVKPLPLDALDPEAFEQFVATLLEYERPDLRVRQAGKAGHAQGGLDVVAVDPVSGLRIGVQCKRMNQFGPAQVDAVVAAFTEEADQKVLALSRVASPQATARIATYPGWDIWDQDDLSRRLRKLAPHVQDQIVDTFFKGQSLELLGRTRLGPWQDFATFFRPFAQPGALFTHDWALVGREANLASLMSQMSDPGVNLILLSAAGGMGKSRLLLEAVRRWRETDRATGLWFLSSVADVTRSDLSGLGPGPKVIVVDDAHDRDTLGALFEFATHPENQTRLLLATRPYARQRLTREASVYGLTPSVIELDHLNGQALKDLAHGMLAAEGKPEGWTDQVVAIAGGSPLIISMAVRILSREEMAPERVRGEQRLRDYVLGRFAKVVTGRLGSLDDAQANLKILELLALVQPFHPQDVQLLALIEAVHGMTPRDSERLLARLIDGGVALRRGAQHRLMPDVLGDYLIDESCIVQGRLSKLAEDVLAAASPRLLRNIVLNLGRLDWRRTDGETAESRLLDAVWRSFETIETDYDDRLDAVRAVSVYQPRQALHLASQLLRKGVALEVVPEILRNIAYTAEYLPEAVALLWEMAQRDSRQTGPHPSHPMRVLAEMAAFEDGKPFEINDALFDFGLAQAARDDVWGGAYTPVDLLEPFLATEGVEDEATARGVTMRPYQLRYDLLQPYRAKVIDTLFELMRRPHPVASRKAAHAMQNALRAPYGLMNSSPSEEMLQRYDAEFIHTLGRLEALVREGPSDLVLMGIAASVSWHADHGGVAKSAAQAVLDALPRDLSFRVTASLQDGWGNLFLDRSTEDWPDNVTAWMEETAAALATEMPDVEARLAYIEERMRALTEAGVVLDSAHVLFQTLTADVEFARALIRQAEQDGDTPSATFVASAAFAVWRHDGDEGRALIARWLDSDRDALRQATPAILWGPFDQLQAADLDLLRRMMRDRDPIVVLGALRAVRVSKAPDPLMLDLAFSAPLEDVRVLEQVAGMLGGRKGGLVERLSEGQVDAFLAALEPLPQLEGHWINEALAALSHSHARKTAAFFRARVLRSMDAPFAFRPANWGPYGRSKLQFNQAKDGPEILADTWDWLRQNWDKGFEFQHGAVHLFEAMFLSEQAGLIAFFDPQLPTARGPDLDLISALLKEVNYQFILNEAPFVVRFLERCAAFDADLLEKATGRLYGAAVSGMYSGTPGEPMPRDLSTLSRVNEILAGLSRLSAAWELYDAVRRHAQNNIEKSRLEGEAMED